MGSLVLMQTAALVLLLLVRQIPLLGFTNGHEAQGTQDMNPLMAPEAVIGGCLHILPKQFLFG